MPTSTEGEAFKYEAEAAENGWHATASLRAAIGPRPLPSLNLPNVAIHVLKTSRDLLDPAVRARFEKVPAELFDHGLLDRLEPAAWAVWYGHTLCASLASDSGGAKVSEATLALATTIKTRMLRVAEYTLLDHPKAMREVAAIRSGSGYADLARDLTRLAWLYTNHPTLVSGGGVHYDPEDVVRAKEAAAAILYETGESQPQELVKAKGETGAAFVVLQDTYQRIGRWGDALWNTDDYLPSLYSLRSLSRRSAASGQQDEDEDAVEGEPGER